MKKLSWIISFLSLIITSIAIQFMPNRVPIHYNINGRIDDYGSKYIYLLIPIIIILNTTLLQFMERRLIINTKNSYEKEKANTNTKVLNIVNLSVVILLTAILFLALYNAYVIGDSDSNNIDIDFLKITSILAGTLFIIIGNYLTKTKLNGVIGLRISWSMYNDNTWRKSNRFAAISIILVGVLTITTAAFANGIVSFIMMNVYTITAIIVMLIYAHKVYKEEISK